MKVTRNEKREKNEERSAHLCLFTWQEVITKKAEQHNITFDCGKLKKI